MTIPWWHKTSGKQWAYIPNEDTSSPTVVIKSLLLLCLVNAAEHCEVATIAIPGAFMQAMMDKTVHMQSEGVMVDILIGIDKDT